MNSKLRGQSAEYLAHQLFVVLDRRLPARLNSLSDLPEGSFSNPLKPTEELAGTIRSANGDVDIIVERLDRGKSGPLWLFSSKTLESIPGLFEEVDEVSVDSVLPGFLVNTRFLGIVLFEWLAFFVGIPLFYLFTSLLNRVLKPLVGNWRRRLHNKPDLPNPQVLPVPIRILLLAAVIRWLLTVISLPLLARQFWFSTASIITVMGCVWLLILLNARIEEYLSRRLQVRNLAGTTSVLRLACRTIDGLIVFAGVLVTLYLFGVKPTAALAGLGVGGIAVAFAAQKTLENVIGGISIIFDRVSLRETVLLTHAMISAWRPASELWTTMVGVPNGQTANLLPDGTGSGSTRPAGSPSSAVLEGFSEGGLRSISVAALQSWTSSLEVEIFAYLPCGWDVGRAIRAGTRCEALREDRAGTPAQLSPTSRAALQGLP